MTQKRVITGLLFIWLAMFTHFAIHNYNVPYYQYTMELQKQAMLRAREMQTTDDMALEVYVPNLLPINYQYLSEWLSRTGQTRPLDFGVTDHQEYVLMYEPNAIEHQRIFNDWMTKWTLNATCSEPEHFGIISIKHCLRQPQSESES